MFFLILDSDKSVESFVCSHDNLVGVPKDEIVNTLKSVGFVGDLLNNGVGSLSGGWKMKLALAMAILRNADILLLDEPTNHLDVANVAWLRNYLTSLTNVTSLIVSHDSSFLDTVVRIV